MSEQKRQRENSSTEKKPSPTAKKSKSIFLFTKQSTVSSISIL